MRWDNKQRILYLVKDDLRIGATSTACPMPTDLKSIAIRHFIDARLVRYNRGDDVFIMKDSRHPMARYETYVEDADEIKHSQS